MNPLASVGPCAYHGGGMPCLDPIRPMRYSLLLILASACPQLALASLALNPSAEDVRNGQPIQWGLYRGSGKAELLASSDAHTGGHSACLRVHALGVWQGKPYLNVGLILGDSDGYRGRQAYPAKPGDVYQLTFWLKGTVAWVNVYAVLWTSERASAKDRASGSILRKLKPTAEWKQYTGVFVAQPKTTRLAIKWQLAGFADQGMAVGELLVDDVTLTKIGERIVRPKPRLRIPAQLTPKVFGKTPAEVAEAVKGGDEAMRRAVEARIAQAETWAAKPDSWYVERTAKHTPLGMWTIACPFHPERVRDFSSDNFEWDIDDPWRLKCKLCKAEGRIAYYPNDRYPDDGTGCYPTDAIWTADHDAAWSKAHSNIPHDRWDGKPHGYSNSGYCYFFLGKCAHEIMTFMAKRTLPQLGEGYVLVKATDSPEAARLARKVKVAMLLLTRAHLGDEYLAKVSGVTTAQFDKLVAPWSGGERMRFPGYQPYDLFDGIKGDPKHPAKRRADIYGDGSFRGDTYARGWLRAYGLIRDSFTEDEEPIRLMIERLLVSQEGDAQRVKPVKPGKLELAIEPFSMNVGSSNNLGGRELLNQFNFGELLNDPHIIDAAVDNCWFYLRNYFNSDGLGRETSPAYTCCAWNSMWGIYRKLYGYRGHYDKTHPWWDEDLGGLNPYRDPEMVLAVAKRAFSVFPDGTLIPWMDSHAWVRPGKQYHDAIVKHAGGLPKEYATYYNGLDPNPAALPSMLMHESRKAVVRSGRGRDQALLSIDYAPNTGHWHPAPMDLILYAKGHELASDLGYFGAMHWRTKDWIRTCPAHNTCIIRDEKGRHDFIHHVQGEIRTVVKLGDPVSVVEVCERAPQDLAYVPGDDPIYQRTCVMVRVPNADDTGDDHYVVDVFRVRGGAMHDYYFHSAGRQCDAQGLELTALPPGLSLYEASGFSPKQPKPIGDGHIKHLRKATTDAAFSVTWCRVPNFLANPPVVSKDVGLRLTMLPAPGTEVFLGQAPGQRRMTNVDRGEVLHVLCARRRNTEAVDRFVSVIEPFRGRPFIRSVEQLPVEPGDADVVALRIDMGARIDYVVVGDGTAVRVATAAGQWLETDAVHAAASAVNNTPKFLTMAGGTYARVGAMAVKAEPAYEGGLIDFDDNKDTLTVQTDRSLPLGDALHDEVIIIEHERGTTTFTIDTVQAAGDGQYVVKLRWSPHVLQNYLRVTDVVGPTLAIEPPPSLEHGFAAKGYQVYKVEADARTRRLGETRPSTGQTITLDTLPSGVSPGDMVGVTKLKKRTDRFHIATSASVVAVD